MLSRCFFDVNFKRKKSYSPKLLTTIFSLKESDIFQMLDWMKGHDCSYLKKSRMRRILNEYSNEEIINNDFIRMFFEQCESDGLIYQGGISIFINPSVLGSSYKIRCRCGEELNPTNSGETQKVSA